MSKEGQPNLITETRNSWIRAKTKGTIEDITKKLHHKFPSLSPTHLNVLGVVGTALGAHWAEKINSREKNKGQVIQQSLAAATMTAFSLCDAFDGSLARTIDKEQPGKVNFKLGQVLDATVDRLEELTMGSSRIKTADKRGRKFGKLAALTATITNPLPSVMRAKAEAQGIIVPEGGKDALSFFGTRVGRAVTSIIATAYPEIKIKSTSIPLQTPLDIITAVSNIKSSIERFKYLEKQDNFTVKLSEEKKEEAKTRLKVLVSLATITFAAAVIAYSRHKKN